MDKAVSEIIQAVKAVGGEAWPILVQQMYISGVIALIWVLTLLTLAGVGLVVVKKVIKPRAIRTPERMEHGYCHRSEWNDWAVAEVVGYAIVAVLLLLSMIVFTSNIDKLIFPEGSALLYLMAQAQAHR